MTLGLMKMVYFLLDKRKVQSNYLILLLCFTMSMVDFPIWNSYCGTSAGIIGAQLSLKQFFTTGSKAFVTVRFLVALLLFFAEKETLAKMFLTELYKNLTVEALSSDNYENLQFDAPKDLFAKIGVRLINSIFANRENARLKM